MIYHIICLILGMFILSHLFHLIHTGKWIKNYKKMISIVFQKVLSSVNSNNYE